MATPRPYTVFRPGPLVAQSDRVWTVDDGMPTIPGGSFPRKMTIVKLVDGTLLFHNAIPLPEPTLVELRQLGRPAWLFVSSPNHTLDTAAFAQHLGLQILCPAPLREELAPRFPIAGNLSKLPLDPALAFTALDGIPGGEGFFALRSDGKTTLIVGDMVLNVPNLPGFWGWMWKLLGFSGSPRVGPVWMKRAVKDRAAFKAHMQRLASGDKIDRLIPTHGPPLEDNVNATLAAIAAKLP